MSTATKLITATEDKPALKLSPYRRGYYLERGPPSNGSRCADFLFFKSNLFLANTILSRWDQIKINKRMNFLKAMLPEDGVGVINVNGSFHIPRIV